MQLSVIIVNYNVKYFLEQCLCSVQKSITHLKAEIIVVDNNSTDGSRAFFERSFPLVRFVWKDENNGFAKANNEALSLASGEYILFLNPDTILPEDCLSKCLKVFQDHVNTGALGVRMIDGTGSFLKESKRSFPSPLTSFYKLAGFARLFPRSEVFAKYHLGHLDDQYSHNVDVLAGAFMMVHQRVLKQVGAFDEEFFMYGEDIDLSYRIQKAGFSNYYFAGTSIIHFKGESTRKGSMNYVRLFYKAMFIFVRKHYGGTKAGIFKLLIQFAIFFTALLSGIAAVVKWISIPVIDAMTILMSFWITKSLWNSYIKTNVTYNNNLLIIAFPIFTIIFLTTAYYCGLYDGGFKQKRLNRSTLISALILLSGYALLPETLRFSRGILLTGTILAFLLTSALRAILIRLGAIDTDHESTEHRQTLIVGSQAEFASANHIMMKAGMHERVLGRIEPTDIPTPKSIGPLHELNAFIKTYHVREVVFCQGALSFTQIIETLQTLPFKTRAKFHASQSTSIIGSDSKDYSGNTLSNQGNIHLSHTVIQRNKRLTAIVVCMLFGISFPIHLLLQKRPGKFFRNMLAVLVSRKDWIGYASSVPHLPHINPGVLTTTGLPKHLNALPQESLEKSDIWYATDYEIIEDLKLIWSGYYHLDA